MKKSKKLKKYKVSWRGTIFIIIIFIISAIFYCASTYYLNIETISVTDKNMEHIARLETIKDVLVVILSICGTNLLLNVLIEVHSKNAFLTEIVNNDIIACPEFYDNMSCENKEKVYKALDQNLNYEQMQDMFANIKSKMNMLMHDYFFESCEYFVICDIYEDYIEKEITKKVVIKSHEETYMIKDFCVGNVSSKLINGKKTFELLSVKINDSNIDINTQFKRVTQKTGNLDEHNEYDTSESYIYKKVLKISHQHPTTITVKCKARTTIDDKLSSFRVTKPCKSFTLNYTINQADKYRLAVDAFGFLDDADDSTNNSSNASVNIRFKDWIFQYDGVVVVILDK